MGTTKPTVPIRATVLERLRPMSLMAKAKIAATTMAGSGQTWERPGT